MHKYSHSSGTFTKETRGGAPLVKRSRHHAIGRKLCLHQPRHMILTASLFPPVLVAASDGAQRAAFLGVCKRARSGRPLNTLFLLEICARASEQKGTDFAFAHRRAVNELVQGRHQLKEGLCWCVRVPTSPKLEHPPPPSCQHTHTHKLHQPPSALNHGCSHGANAEHALLRMHVRHEVAHTPTHTHACAC